MINVVHGGRHQEVKPTDLSKIRCINEDTTSKTIYITSQRNVCADNHMLSRNYGTTCRILRYTLLKEYIYIDTLFAMHKVINTTIGNICTQLFVTDKGFVYDAPLKADSDILHSIAQILKIIGV